MTDETQGFGQGFEKQQYITFYLNNEEYAADALHVQEIVELSNITRAAAEAAMAAGEIPQDA